MASFHSLFGNEIVPRSVENNSITDAMLKQSGNVLSRVSDLDSDVDSLSAAVTALQTLEYTAEPTDIIEINTLNASVNSAQLVKCGHVCQISLELTLLKAINVNADGTISTPYELGTIVEGKRPRIMSAGVSDGFANRSGQFWYNIGGGGTLIILAAEGTGTARVVPINARIRVFATYLAA